jgi:hypothetical protein
MKIKVRDGKNGCDKIVLASADTVTVITVFYIKEQIAINLLRLIHIAIAINSHCDDHN